MPTTEPLAGLTAIAAGEPLERDRLCIAGRDGQRAIRTPSWYLRTGSSSRDATASAAELYFKPDDRFEVNELLGRCPDVAEQLIAAYDDFARSVQASPPAPMMPLAEILVEIFN